MLFSFWSWVLGQVRSGLVESFRSRSVLSMLYRSCEGFFGNDGILRLANNIGCTVLSLYSGLGGAELSMDMIYRQILTKTQNARKPDFAVACDIDPVCRDVLFGHKEPPRQIVGDLLNFLEDDIKQEQLGKGQFRSDFASTPTINIQNLKTRRHR